MPKWVPNKKYTPEFKKLVVETMQEEHLGYCETAENGIVYTVEGNSGDSCRENHYPVGYYEILGYGILNP